jgi:hypothetical protein
MKKGDRVKFSGRKGTVIRSMPNGMIDIRFDDSSAIERRSAGRLARANSSRRRRNPKEMIGIRSQERVSPLGLFTKEDPPRINKAQDTYCGNPIDGTAYYAFVSTEKMTAMPFITTHDVAELLQTGHSPGSAVKEYVRRRKMEAGEGVIVGDVIVTPVAGGRGVQATYVEKKKYGREVHPEDVTHVTSPSGESKYLADKGTKQEREVVVSYDPQRAARMRGKHLQRASKARGRDWDDPSLYGKGGKASAPANALVGEVQGKGKVYYRLKITEPLTSALQRDYNFYTSRRYTAKDMPSGTPLYAYVEASAGVDRDTAIRLIQCQMVTVLEEGEYRGGRRPSNPNFADLRGGYQLVIEDRAKANSPFFSFVRTPYSPTNLREKFAPCFSAEVTKDIQLLGEGARVFKGYASALKSAKGLLSSERQVTKDGPVRTLKKLIYAYTAVNRWREKVERTSDDLEEKIDLYAPLANPDLSSALNTSLEGLRGIAFSRSGTESRYQDEPEETMKDLFAVGEFTGYGPAKSYFQTEIGREFFRNLGVTHNAVPSPFNAREKKVHAEQIKLVFATQQKFRWATAREFYALLVAYYALGGLPVANEADKASTQLRKLDSRLQGGERGYGGTQRIVFKTYNPLLFQLLEQTWKTDFTLRKHPHLIGEVDTIGRLGVCLSMVHNAEARHEPVKQYLLDQFAPSERVGKAQMEKTKGSTYTDALLFWPFGAVWNPMFFDAANAFIMNPVSYIGTLKSSLQRGMVRVTRSPKAGKKSRLPVSDANIDWSVSGQPHSPLPRATVSLVAGRRGEIESMIATLDRRIKARAKPNRRRRR